MSKQINWKDFEIKDLKPNLIPNGWDSFEPYGNEGKETKAPLEVFEDGYTRNLIEVNNNWKTGGVVESRDKGDSWEKLWYSTSTRITMEQTITVNGDFTVSIYNKDYDYLVVLLDEENNYLGRQDGFYGWANTRRTISHVGKVGLSIRKNNNDSMSIDEAEISKIKLNTGSDDSFYSLAWEDIPEEDKPVRAWDNMAVHYTPLGNGLTRIQTWGGRVRRKLRFLKGGMIAGDPFNFSMYVNNLGTEIRVRHDVGGTNRTIDEGYDGLFSNNIKVSVADYLLVGLDAPEPDYNLDFIASDPQIVEGDKPNPTMIVTDLDDGREHVQVYGANVDTKLISKPINEFEGELYSLKTEIENLGISLDMVSTVSEEVTTINKGDNKVEHIGELEGNQIIVELGAKNG